MGLTYNPFTGNLDYTGGSSGVPTVADATERAALTPYDGQVVYQLDDDRLYAYNLPTLDWLVIGGYDVVLGIDPFETTSVPEGLSISSNKLIMHPANGSNPGGLSAVAQTIGGVKTFASVVYASAGIDVSSGTLSIGSVNASIINIGNASATVNFNGTVNNNNVTNLNVTDQLVTLNKGGGAGSASGTGMEFEENSLITGYIKTSGDRNSFLLKAPNTAGITTITPGASGITLDQSSHDPVTLGTANGLSLSTQALSLQLSSGSQTGALSSTDWSTFNNKEPAITVGTSAQYWRGDKTFQTLDTLAVPENTNLYFTDERAQDAVGAMVTNSSKVSLTYVDGTPSLTADIVALSLTDGDISATANIDATKLGTGVVDNTEFNYLNGVTSAIQTQLNDKVSTSAYTAGSVLFSSGATVTQDNTNFFWNNTSKRLGIGTNSPICALDVQGNNAVFRIKSNAGPAGIVMQPQSGTTSTSLEFADGTTTLNVARIQTSSNDLLFATLTTNTERLRIRSTGEVVVANLTASRAVVTDASNNLSSSTTTDTEIGYVSGVTSSIQTQLNSKVDSVTGDIAPTSFTYVVTGAATNVTGLAFANGTVRSFEAQVSVTNATDGLYQVFKLLGIQKGASWDMSITSAGDASLVNFSITTAGQVQYTNSSTNGGTMKFRASTLSI